jgi:hypothetical protein
VKLWLLTLPDTVTTYDCARGFVVRAKNESEARAFAVANCGDEGASAWLEIAACLPLPQRGESGVILRDFLAG